MELRIAAELSYSETKWLNLILLEAFVERTNLTLININQKKAPFYNLTDILQAYYLF